MLQLLDGIRRFQTGYHADNADLFRTLAQGQKPEILFLTCSDSRVKPTLLTDTRPGQIFELRNAGNMLPSHDEAQAALSGETATLQYAVEVLQVRHIIVCGHSDCGAVKALIGPPERLDNLEFVSRWVAQAQSLREQVMSLPEDQRHLAAIERNVLLQLDALFSYAFVKRYLAAGRLMVHGWVYDIGSGEVTSYDPVQDRFRSVHDVYAGAMIPDFVTV